MSEPITLDRLEGHLTFFSKMYDAVRIVDPVRKRVMECRGNAVDQTEEICYEYWKDRRICENCISVRAYHNDKSFMKLEQSPDAIIMVTALPIQTKEQPAVLELMKNATDSMMIGTGNYSDGRLMRNIVSDINHLVITDQLTSLYNRRFVSDRLPVDIIQATIDGSPLSVIFMDIDNFKEINDTYGHAVGDLVLQQVSDVIKRNIRGSCDWSARYGGDEFLICLTNTTSHEAYRVAERIRRGVQKTAIPTKKETIQLTVSLGIHTMEETKLTPEELISLADRKMYEAKNSGKNRTMGDVEAELA